MIALKNFVLGLVLTAGLSLSAQESSDKQATPLLKKISPHVYSYVGITGASPAGNSFGANAGLIVGNDAVLVVDTLVSAHEAERFLKDIRAVTDKPVKYVANTHYHLDHAWGNCVFAQNGALIIGHEKLRGNKKLEESASYAIAHPEIFGMTPKDTEGTKFIFPNICFSQRMSIDLGGVTVELSCLGPSHNDSSIIVYVPEDKTLFTGDAVFKGYHPFLAEGDLENWPKVIEALRKIPATAVIPGHGPLVKDSDFTDLIAYLKDFDVLAKELSKGKKAEDAPAIAEEMIKRLPAQNRTELPGLVEMNLRSKYLPPPQVKAQ